MLLFAICFLPMHIVYLCFFTNPNFLYTETWHTIKITSFCLLYTNSCINPIALYVVSTNYRKYLNRLFCYCCMPGRFNNASLYNRSTTVRHQISHYFSRQYQSTLISSSFHFSFFATHLLSEDSMNGVPPVNRESSI